MLPALSLLCLAPCDSQTSSINGIFLFLSSAISLSVKASKPCTCVINTALVFELIFDNTSSSFIPNVYGSISTNTGVNPFCITEAISEIQVNGGTIISPPSGYLIFNIAIVNKLAEAPELTKMLYFTPNHFDHSSSNALTFGP